MELPEKSGVWVSYLQVPAYGVRKTASDKIRILMVDEHTVYKKSLREMFEVEPDIEVVGEAANGKQAVELVSDLKPDIVLMDINVPSMAGIEATRALTDAYPGILVILLTTFEDKEHLRDARRAGASAYVMKDAGADILLRTVHDVVSGDTPLFQGDEHSINTVSESEGSLTVAPVESVGTGSLITSNERTILKLLADGWDNNQIAENMGVPEGMVRTYVAEICRKLGLSGREAAAQYGRQL